MQAGENEPENTLPHNAALLEPIYSAESAHSVPHLYYTYNNIRWKW